MIHLDGLTPAAEEGWWVLFELANDDSESWTLIGGQMIQLLAAEHHAVDAVRPTEDLDIVVNVRLRQKGIGWITSWLLARNFDLAEPDANQIAGRFTRQARDGRGRTIFDVLAPEGLGERADLTTLRPARTIAAPASTQALDRTQLIEVTVTGLISRETRTGIVPRPSILGALVVKAAATAIAGRDNAERDWQDAALLLSVIADPAAIADECVAKDRARLSVLRDLEDRGHIGWAALGDDAYRRGRGALVLLLQT